MKTLFSPILFVSVLLAIASPAVASSVASAAKKGAVVGYAKVNADATVVTFGGKGTTSVTAEAVAPGEHKVKFMGKYPSDISASKVVVQTTAEELMYGVTNTQVLSATATEIDVDVSDWESDLTLNTGSNIFVTIFIGQ